jgi:hypothetical protein
LLHVVVQAAEAVSVVPAHSRSLAESGCLAMLLTILQSAPELKPVQVFPDRTHFFVSLMLIVIGVARSLDTVCLCKLLRMRPLLCR